MSKKKSNTSASRDLLGHVTLPSGILVILDMGLMPFWCHDRPPTIPPGFMDDEAERNANEANDFRIEGPDAETAGRAFGRPNDPLHLYDIPAQGTEIILRDFQKILTKKRLDAKLVPLEERIPHRERVNLTLQNSASAGPLQFHGIQACAAGGLPSGEKLSVYGEMLGGKHYPDRWGSVYLECRPEVPVVRSEKIGEVGVDEARLMFADADVLGNWQHFESFDGLADIVFWGRDAENLARMSGANEIDEEQWGWVNIAVQEAILRGEDLERLRDGNGWKVAVDFRPHSHHYEVLAQVHASETQSGTCEIGDHLVCGFMTSWGDGFFPVYRDLDKDGNVVRVRVELGCEEIVERQRKLEDWHHGFFAQLALVSKRVTQKNKPIGYLSREEPAREKDSGWIVYAGDEPDDFVDDASNWEYVVLREIVEKEKELEKILRALIGTRIIGAIRSPVFAKFLRPMIEQLC